ncbi:MAG: hypothetical protein ACRD0N_15225 [Acidimicrobiales bacterium]
MSTPAPSRRPSSRTRRLVATDPPVPFSTTASTRYLSSNGLAWLRSATGAMALSTWVAPFTATAVWGGVWAAALEQAPEAYEQFQKKQDGAVKILFQPGG